MPLKVGERFGSQLKFIEITLIDNTLLHSSGQQKFY